jgi:tetratricopeptide (TPR) repeat protein
MADATAGDLPARSARTAELLDELARLPNVRRTDVGKQMVKSAVDRYEALLPARPEACIAAAGLLGYSERQSDGFALIEKHTPLLPLRLRAAAGLAVLRAGGATDRQFALVQSWLAAAAATEPDSIALKLNEGEFHALRQDYAAAEKAYQWVLDRDPRNVVALNNLAWILAPDPNCSAKALALVERAAAEVGLTGEILDTRSRIRIAAKQFTLAEADSLEALAREKTPLRLFHLALAKDGRTPPQREEARQAFRSAQERGLEPRTVHPTDLPAYRALESGQPKKGNGAAVGER